MKQQYNLVAMILHWLIALFIAVQCVLIEIADAQAEQSLLGFKLIQWHKSLGISLLLAMAFRLIWRLLFKPPKSLPAAAWQKTIASLTHGAFYLLIIAVPLLGWAMVSVSNTGIGTLLFERWAWPNLPLGGPSEALGESFETLHEFGAKLILVLAALHIAAALKHQFIDKDQLLWRMTPSLGGITATLCLLGLGVAATVYLPNSSATGENISAASSVKFSVNVLSQPVHGQFASSEFIVNNNGEDIAGGSIEATVMVASHSSDNSQVNESIAAAIWLDSEGSPFARFKSTAIAVEGDAYLLTGTLNIKGVTKKITTILRKNADTYHCILTINRLDFGVGNNYPDADTVGIDVRLEISFPAA